MPARHTSRTTSSRVWSRWPDHKLLDVRLCDLGLDLERSPVHPRIQQLYRELERRHLAFRPHFWLSDDWYTPDGVPGIAIPFYMAHRRLMELERTQMREVEGGTPEWCMRILRHETGHAIENGYRLRRRRRRQALFGKTSEPYPQHYAPKPDSKRYVLHLESYYAQSHPDEDFAETFAVWLTPGSKWRRQYAGWPALRKLEYVDEVMKALADVRPVVHTRRVIDPLRTLTRTLREHYREKRARYGLESLREYDPWLRKVFSTQKEHQSNPPAARFLRRVRPELRRKLAALTGEHQYTIDRVLDDMVQRAAELKLRLIQDEDATLLDFGILLTGQIMRFLRSGRHRVAL
ncbi:MAG: putative zinc-binding metallopeptidase [bacterium]|nr:putative zinc-binding metallopeptidase [bacterium]